MKAQVGNDFLSRLIDAEALYNNAPCGYFSMLPDGTIVKVNNTFMTWAGYTSAELFNRLNVTDLLSNGGKLYYHMFYAPLLALQGKVNEMNFDIYRKDNTCFPALMNANAIKDAGGKIVAVNVAVTDITDRKKYERELLHAKVLAESEKNKFETVTAYIPEMIWTADCNGELNYINKRFADCFNISNSEEIKSRINDLVFAGDRLSAKRAWGKGIRSGDDFQLQLRLRTRSGEFNWHLLKGTPYRNAENLIERWLGSCTNINGHVRELEMRDEFISIASHELKTPITSLNLALQVLLSKKNANSEREQSLLEQASRNAKKIQALIDDLLNVKRLTEGQLSLHKKRFNIRQLIQNCKHSYAPETQLIIQASCSDLEIEADEHRLEQVIVNFVNNALKYAPGSPVNISIHEEAGKMILRVSDKGPGIPSYKIPRLFERYYRADHSGSEYSGLGLGLYISAEIIKKHGGTIGVASDLGEGSTFWFSININ